MYVIDEVCYAGELTPDIEVYKKYRKKLFPKKMIAISIKNIFFSYIRLYIFT